MKFYICMINIEMDIEHQNYIVGQDGDVDKYQFMDELRNLYFGWMAQVAISDYRRRDDYLMLLEHLDNINFTYSIPFDENRFNDGQDLRNRFGQENNIAGYDIDEMSFRKGPCSILEMMVALSLKYEENFMSDPAYGNRISN